MNFQLDTIGCKWVRHAVRFVIHGLTVWIIVESSRTSNGVYNATALDIRFIPRRAISAESNRFHEVVSRHESELFAVSRCTSRLFAAPRENFRRARNLDDCLNLSSVYRQVEREYPERLPDIRKLVEKARSVHRGVASSVSACARFIVLPRLRFRGFTERQ